MTRRPGRRIGPPSPLSCGSQYTTSVTQIYYNGSRGKGIARVIIDPAADEYEKERLRQRAVKLSFFKAAQKVTGVTPTWGALTGIRPAKLAAGYLEKGMTPRQVDHLLRDTYSVSETRRELCIEAAQAGLKAKADLKPEDISSTSASPSAPPDAPIAALCPRRWKRASLLWSRIWRCCWGRSPKRHRW